MIRVPVEVLKQRKQALIVDKESLGLKLLYRGYWTTVLRDTPFSMVQFPLWEYLKRFYSSRIEREIYPVESAICGAISGYYRYTTNTSKKVNYNFSENQIAVRTYLHVMQF